MLGHFLDRFCAEVDENVKRLQDSLGDGTAGSFADYKCRSGEIKGYKAAKSLAQDLTKRLDEDMDYED